MILRSYNELKRLKTFDERFEYLRIGGTIGLETFGYDRHVADALYHSREWKAIRREVILRDEGLDLGVDGFEIYESPLVHHINPISLEDIELGADCVFDLNNLITTTFDTHGAIHYGTAPLALRLPIERRKGDTCLWIPAY